MVLAGTRRYRAGSGTLGIKWAHRRKYDSSGVRVHPAFL